MDCLRAIARNERAAIPMDVGPWLLFCQRHPTLPRRVGRCYCVRLERRHTGKAGSAARDFSRILSSATLSTQSDAELKDYETHAVCYLNDIKPHLHAFLPPIEQTNEYSNGYHTPTFDDSSWETVKGANPENRLVRQG